MKTINHKTHVKVDGDIETKAFGLVFDRHMVNILSNQLYEDKVLAIVRELSTNALDSQVEAGFDGPFDVHLPTWTNMDFWIRDYGTGMSPEKIDNVYRNYGASDRNESNDFTGCMGLGSKTPFCYHTRSCTVDSWCDGIHYQYECYLDEDGMPQISLVTKKVSNEPSGVKITIPVKSEDRYEFGDAAKKIYRFFNVVPSISGNTVDIEPFDYTLEEDNWKYNDYDDMRIVMGNVAYRVSASALGDLTRPQRKVINNGFHVYVPIGEVGVTASREGLDYTNRTKVHIRGYINSIISVFNKKVQDEVDKCKNLWDARLKFVEYEKGDLNGIFDASKITYDGKPLCTVDNYIDWDQMHKDDEVEVNMFATSSWRKPERKTIRQLKIGKNPQFFTNDLKVGGFVRSIWQAQQENQSVMLVTFKTPIAKAKFCELMGFDESYFTDISTIPSPTKRSGGGTRGSTTKVLQYSGGCYTKSGNWTNTDVDMDAGGIYVEFNRFNAKIHKWMEHPKRLSNLFSILRNAGIVVPIVYGVKTAHIKKFEKHSEWTTFWEWATKQVKTVIAGKDLETQKEYKNELDNLGYNGYNRKRFTTREIHKLATYCNPKTELVKYSEAVKAVEALAKDGDTASHMRDACMAFGIKIPKTTATVPNLRNMETVIYDRYSLFKKYDGDSFDHLAIYVNAVDGV